VHLFKRPQQLLSLIYDLLYIKQQFVTQLISFCASHRPLLSRLAHVFDILAKILQSKLGLEPWSLTLENENVVIDAGYLPVVWQPWQDPVIFALVGLQLILHREQLLLLELSLICSFCCSTPGSCSKPFYWHSHDYI
jgi:hypothetical protein